MTTETRAKGDGVMPEAGADAAVQRKVNKTVLLAALVLIVAAVAGVALVFWFVATERQRDIQGWQIRLGIVADSRNASVEEWVETQYSTLRELAENASLQIYLTVLMQTGGARGGGAAADDGGQADYLRNLLVATADRTGFKSNSSTGATVAANVAPAPVAGLALTDADGNVLVATPTMPPIAGALKDAIRRIPNGDQGIVDMYVGVNGDPTMAFVMPLFSVQGERGAGAAIGMVIGVRVIGADLFHRLEQPGEIEKTAETYLARIVGPNVEYLSPLADQTAPLKKKLAQNTADNVDTYLIKNGGGFAANRLDYTGAPVLATGRPLTVPGVTWTLVRKVTSAEALAESSRRQTTLLTTFLLVIVGVGVTIVAVWRHGTSVRAAESAERYRIAAERFSNIMKFLRVVTDGQPTQVVAVTEEGKFTFANLTAAQGAGIEKEEMMGKTMANVWGPVRSKYYQEVNREIIDNREAILAEKRKISHIKTFEDEGGRHVIRSFHIPLRPDRDHPPGCLMILDDITEFVEQRERRDRVMDQLVTTLLEVVGRPDPFTAEQPDRAAKVAEAIANEMGMDDDVIRTVRAAAKLMNLGRVGVPREILVKRGPLNAPELELFRIAIRNSAKMVEGVEFDGPVVDTLRQIHERADGKGPLKMPGVTVLQTAQIVAVADAFAAMISPRAHRRPLSLDLAEAEISAQAGARFDRKAVAALLHTLENREGRAAWKQFAAPPAAE